MKYITVVFTKNLWNPLSWFIRWVLPRSRFALAISSHCFIAIHDGLWFESAAPYGVKITNAADATKRNHVVAIRTYRVEDATAALAFLMSQVGKKYDYKGAVGLGIAPSRTWHDDDAWFCYELAAACLKASGGEKFNNLSHVNETALLAIASE